jgi:hypothetical protein
MPRMNKKKDGHVPSATTCRGCGRILIITDCRWGFPDKDTPRENIREIVDPTFPMFSVWCTCGYYTISIPQQRQQPE